LKRLLVSFACMALVVAPLFADANENVRKAPELAFKIPGKPDQLLSQYRGKVVALEFIFTTCPHCQAASHYMTQLQGELGSRGLQVIDVAVNANADLLVENFSKDMGVNFPVGWTTQQAMTTFMGFQDGRFVVPQLVLIDRKGNIHWQTPASTDDGSWEKLMNQDAIRQHIETLLAQTGTASSVSHKTAATAKVASVKKPS
jgi:thiol-disulfide isomerase/thioredoxin